MFLTFLSVKQCKAVSLKSCGVLHLKLPQMRHESVTNCALHQCLACQYTTACCRFEQQTDDGNGIQTTSCTWPVIADLAVYAYITENMNELLKISKVKTWLLT